MPRGIRRSSVVLGYCEDCGGPVHHDQEDGEFVYDAERPVRLLAVYCPTCSVARFGVLPAGCESAAESEAFLDRITRGLIVERRAREKVSAKIRRGERVTGCDLAELAGVGAREMRHSVAVTNAAERLRRYRSDGYRKVGSPLGDPARTSVSGPGGETGLVLVWDADAAQPGGRGAR